MGLIASQMTKSKTKPELVPIAKDSPYADPVNVRRLVYAVSIELATGDKNSSAVGSLGFNEHASTVWFSAAPPSLSLGVPLINGKRSVDWQIDVAGGAVIGGGVAIHITTPYYATKDGELANKKTYVAVRDRLRSALTSGRLPAADLDRDLIAAGLREWGFTRGPAMPVSRQLGVEASVDPEKVVGYLERMLFKLDRQSGAYVRPIGVLDESTVTVTLSGSSPCQIQLDVRLEQGRSYAESLVSVQLMETRLRRLAEVLQEQDSKAVLTGDWTGITA